MKQQCIFGNLISYGLIFCKSPFKLCFVCNAPSVLLCCSSPKWIWDMLAQWITFELLIPYSGKFSRGSIFTDRPLSYISQFNFRGRVRLYHYLLYDIMQFIRHLRKTVKIGPLENFPLYGTSLMSGAGSISFDVVADSAHLTFLLLWRNMDGVVLLILYTRLGKSAGSSKAA